MPIYFQAIILIIIIIINILEYILSCFNDYYLDYNSLDHEMFIDSNVLSLYDYDDYMSNDSE